MVALALAACSGDDDAPATKRRETVDLSGAQPATFVAHGSVEQVWLTGADAGEELRLVDRDDGLVDTQTADPQGSVIFRDVPPGKNFRVAGVETVSATVDVTRPRDVPDDAFYSGQTIAPGYGYLETRDGTLLAINVTLPGPPEAGPYPTVIEYSGYSPADPASRKAS